MRKDEHILLTGGDNEQIVVNITTTNTTANNVLTTNTTKNPINFTLTNTMKRCGENDATWSDSEGSGDKTAGNIDTSGRNQCEGDKDAVGVETGVEEGPERGDVVAWELRPPDGGWGWVVVFACFILAVSAN